MPAAPVIHLTSRQFEMLVLVYLAQRLKVGIPRLVALTKIPNHEVTSCLGHLRGQQMITNTDRPVVARDRVRLKPSGADSGPEVVILPCIDGGVTVGREVTQSAGNVAGRFRDRCEVLLAAVPSAEENTGDVPSDPCEAGSPDNQPGVQDPALMDPALDEPTPHISAELVLELVTPPVPLLAGASPFQVLSALIGYDRALYDVESALTEAANRIAQDRQARSPHIAVIQAGVEVLEQPFPIP